MENDIVEKPSRDDSVSRSQLTAGVWLMGGLALALHLITANGYGIFRDELYYIACSEQPALGYVDHPPLSILFLTLWRAIFGDSLFALRLPPALAHTASTILFGMIARELGAGRFAQTFAALAAALMPAYLGTASFYSMNAFDVTFWAVLVFLLCRIVRTGNAQLWIVFGIVAGVGLQNKFSVGFLGMALAVALVVCMQWKTLRAPQLYAGGVIAALIFLPHVYWMYSTDWLTLEFMRNASSSKNAATNPVKYFFDQLLMAHLLLLPVWLTGIVYSLRAAAMKPYRMLGVMFIFLFLFFSLTNGKSYYLSPGYALIMPVGAVAIEQFAKRRGTWFRPVALGALAVGGLAIAPMAIPLMPPQALMQYERMLGLRAPKDEVGHDAALSQHFADRFGWKELVENVAKVYNALPEAERAKCAILCSNYGEAGAIDFFGRAQGLPPAITTHNNYWLWGPRNATGEILIVVGGLGEEFAELGLFESGGEVARSQHPLAEQDEIPIYVYRGLKPPATVEALWAQSKMMI